MVKGGNFGRVFVVQTFSCGLGVILEKGFQFVVV